MQMLISLVVIAMQDKTKINQAIDQSAYFAAGMTRPRKMFQF